MRPRCRNGLGNVHDRNLGYNVLDGGLGADTLIGGLGNDTYIVDNLGDTITEASALASEIDTVRARSMDWDPGRQPETFSSPATPNWQNLILTGNATAVLVPHYGATALQLDT
ncbi:hypothetical protein [Pseudomonas sp. FW300-N1B4]|uniref:hypothetical protein n=1 Tax=Pseudomonas sp. FW300-N1B4 TaxID=2751315 RepID=UPI00216B3200|nr:hypothetical protein [Pseudomonas sp. FW300-N1B4]